MFLAVRRGLALLARAMHTQRALTLKLRRAGFGAAAAAQAVPRLQQLGYLDDAGFARLWTRGRAARGGESCAQVLAGLRRRGVAQDEAQAALAAEYPPAREAEVCRALAARLAQRLPPAAGGVAGGVRVAGQLARRGFPGAAVRRALQELHLTLDGLEEE